MTKVITYGTYDLFHYGHQRLLERAKALGDYLIVGVTGEDFDKARGKINVQQSLMERIEAVRATGLADEIIVEEYEGQKIDDIRRYDVDIFAIGSDWVGKFDYLNAYCKVVYLPRTEGISSTQLRAENQMVRLGAVGNGKILEKYCQAARSLSNITFVGAYTENAHVADRLREKEIAVFDSEEVLLSAVDAVYLIVQPENAEAHIRKAFSYGCHALVESPVVSSKESFRMLKTIAEEKQLVLMDAIKTAYATAYDRLLLIAKSGGIGEIVSVEATCTSLSDLAVAEDESTFVRGSLNAWGPTAMLPVFQLLGTDYQKVEILSRTKEDEKRMDFFTAVRFTYEHAIANVKTGIGVKSEGELIISGTKGYLYVPAPWWKTDFFELRLEDPAQNRKYFYQLEEEGIRYELVSFLKKIKGAAAADYVDSEISEAMIGIIERFEEGKDVVYL